MSRTDRVIALGLVTLLLALLGVAAAHRSTPVRAASPPAPGVAPGASAPGGAATSSTPTTIAPSSSAPAPSTTPAPTGPVSAVGDSLMLDIQPYLASDLPGVRVDGMVSRQFASGVGVLQSERAAGILGRVVVVELGTNGSVTTADFDAMMQAAAGATRVVFVNVDVPRSWEADDNVVLAAGVARYPGVAVLADWYSLASGHPEWFAPDQVHLQPAGAQAMAGLIAANV